MQLIDAIRAAQESNTKREITIPELVLLLSYYGVILAVYFAVMGWV